MKQHAVVLAAGQGTRMKSALPKVLHPIGGLPMIGRVLLAAQQAGLDSLHVVLGHGADAVRDWLGTQPGLNAQTVIQTRQLGTGHAVRQALPGIPDQDGVIVLYGDVPLVTPETIRALNDAAAGGLALATMEVMNPQGYGRILRDGEGRVTGIVEEQDASPAQRRIREINTGLLAAPAALLAGWLAQVGNQNAKGEYYLTDILALAVRDGVPIATIAPSTPDELEGVNDPAQLARAERSFQHRQAEALQRAGLYLADAQRFDLRGNLSFGSDVHVDIGCVFEGEVKLGDGVRIGPYSVLKNVELGAGTLVDSHCVLDSAKAGADCRIGPFARLRPGAWLGDRVHVGNYVEIKKSSLGDDSKANHHAYLGDATIGARVNIGAGVITCNYDGEHKHPTTIGDDVFVGTDSQLIAPLTIGAGAYIGAGSSIAQDVAADTLTICRAREQKSIPGWSRLRKKL